MPAAVKQRSAERVSGPKCRVVSVEINNAQIPDHKRLSGDSMPTHAACGQTWNGDAAAHCSGCHRTFSGTTLFDRHRSNAGEHGKCVDPATLTDGQGTPMCEPIDGIWRYPAMSEADKLARFGSRA